MKSRDFHPVTRPDTSVSTNVLQPTARPGRSVAKPIWIWLIILIVAVLYLISPIDFVPDILPILGWIDDVVIAISAAVIAVPKIIRR